MEGDRPPRLALERVPAESKERGRPKQVFNQDVTETNEGAGPACWRLEKIERWKFDAMNISRVKNFGEEILARDLENFRQFCSRSTF
jgi:hypothetical protein